VSGDVGTCGEGRHAATTWTAAGSILSKKTSKKIKLTIEWLLKFKPRFNVDWYNEARNVQKCAEGFFFH